jgi:serine protease AprX
MRLVISLIMFSVIAASQLFGQVAPNKYRIYLKDKNHNQFSIEHPEEFLSEKSINRRLKQEINIVENDLPVSQYYIDSLKNLGFTVLNTSKWLNTVTVYSTNPLLIDELGKVEFVKSVQKLSSSVKKETIESTSQSIIQYSANSDNSLNYGESGNQIRLHNGHILHQSGYQGQGITIAVIDAGFYNADLLPAFDSLKTNNQILATFDFVDKGISVYEDNNHGMNVLSIIGGNIPGKLIGSAPKANFLLLRSEDVFSEYSVEEDNWAAAAEFADSAGADIINTSLGYSVFDNPAQNYTYLNMDGNTAFVTKAADLAASKGMIVVVSAGNQGNDAWRYISAPADGDSVLAVGAVNIYASYAEFSSRGPSSDGRVKPNVAAVGYQTILQDISGQVSKGNGTSFSAPIISGLAACLWQALPDLTNMEIIARIEQSSHQFSNPDYKLGYGIPDFAKAASLTNILTEGIGNFHFEAYPNPFKDQFTIFFNNNKSHSPKLKIEIYNVLGEKVFNKYFSNSNNIITINNLNNLPEGIYIISATSSENKSQLRISKTN